MAPEIGAIVSKFKLGGRLVQRGCTGAHAHYAVMSETEMREVTVADGDAAAGGQQAVDRGQQAAEQGAGRYEADGCSLGHVGPLFVRCGGAPLRDLDRSYVYQMPVTTGLFA